MSFTQETQILKIIIKYIIIINLEGMCFTFKTISSKKFVKKGEACASF